MKRTGLTAAFLAALSVLSATAIFAQAPPPRTRGTIVSVDGDTVQMKTRRGETVAIHLGDKTAIIGVVQGKLSDLGPGRFIGTTAAPQPDGTLKAIEIHAFPESMRGMGEGHYAWDLGSDSTMTNGSIGTLNGTNGRSMTVTYSGGQQKTITVPDDVAVVDFQPGDRSLLKPGARALVIGNKANDGSVNAGAVVVGENGVEPPM